MKNRFEVLDGMRKDSRRMCFHFPANVDLKLYKSREKIIEWNPNWSDTFPAALEKEIVSSLVKSRGIKAEAARAVVYHFSRNIILYREYSNTENFYSPSNQSLEALENFRTAALALWKSDGPFNDCRVFDYYDYGTSGATNHLQAIIQFLEGLPKDICPGRPPGRERTTDERRELVGKACEFWERITGKAPTCTISDLKPGFHNVFKKIWVEVSDVELRDEALRTDIKGRRKSQ